MTAIIKTTNHAPPPLSKAGLVLPGLGHLLTGHITTGLGLLLLDGIALWAAVSGLPRLGSVLFTATGAPVLHGFVALVSLFVAVGGLWFTAWRYSSPRELTEQEFNSNRNIFLRYFKRHNTGMLGLFGVGILVLFVLLAPMIAPFPADGVDHGPTSVAPGFAIAPLTGPFADRGETLYLMGTDKYGRDVFSRLLYGGVISLTIGLISVSLAATIGTVLGATAAFFGGIVDRVIMWFVDLLLSLPRLVLLLAIVGMFRPTGSTGIYIVVCILGFTGWMGVCRIVRSQVLSLKQQEFIQAARALGYSSPRIVLRHLIPNAMAPVIVYCSLAIGSTMLVEAGLSFLGLGVPQPIPTWGNIITDGKDVLRNAPWVALFPGLCIVGAVMSLNLLGDGLRDALDPKLRGR